MEINVQVLTCSAVSGMRTLEWRQLLPLEKRRRTDWRSVAVNEGVRNIFMQEHFLIIFQSDSSEQICSIFFLGGGVFRPLPLRCLHSVSRKVICMCSCLLRRWVVFYMSCLFLFVFVWMSFYDVHVFASCVLWSRVWPFWSRFEVVHRFWTILAF